MFKFKTILFPFLFLAFSTSYSIKTDALHCEIRGNENKEIYLEKDPLIDHFHFILSSNQNGIKVFQEWNSWGYYTRYFSATLADHPESTTYFIRKRPQIWTKNAPTTHLLNQGEFLITDVYLCNGNWSITPPLPNDSPAHLTVTPHFEIKSDSDAARSAVWVGHIQGNSKEIYLEKTCIDRLNKPQIAIP